MFLRGTAVAAETSGLPVYGFVICSNDHDPAAALGKEPFRIVYVVESGPIAVKDADRTFLVKLDLGSSDTAYVVIPPDTQTVADRR